MQEGQFYEPHHDFFAAGGASVTAAEPAYTPPQGSNRFATVIIYLTDAEDDNHGGHTVFPFAARTNVTRQVDAISFAGSPSAPTCDFPALHQRRGLMVRPRRGDAVIFYNQLPNGTLDGRTRHGSCPVIAGSKEAVNVWIWNGDVIYR